MCTAPASNSQQGIDNKMAPHHAISDSDSALKDCYIRADAAVIEIKKRVVVSSTLSCSLMSTISDTSDFVNPAESGISTHVHLVSILLTKLSSLMHRLM